MQEEVWKPVPGLEGRYEASNTGLIRNVERWIRCSTAGKTRLLKQRILSTHSKNGYFRVSLEVSVGKAKSMTVHRLVALAFLSNPNNYPAVNHKDGNKANNNISNLEWVTNAQNNTHARVNKLFVLAHGDRMAGAKLKDHLVVEIRELASKGMTHQSLADKYGVSRSIVTRVVNRQIWTHVT